MNHRLLNTRRHALAAAVAALTTAAPAAHAVDYIWTKSAAYILQKVIKANARISAT